MEARLDEANRLAEGGRTGEALEVFEAALDRDPGHAAANFGYACLLDGLGREREAIPRYECSIARGLSGEELQEATINLGSSYRAVGEPEKAVEVLSRFPENRAARVFLAMALHDLGEPGRTVEILLESCRRPLRIGGSALTGGPSRNTPNSSTRRVRGSRFPGKPDRNRGRDTRGRYTRRYGGTTA